MDEHLFNNQALYETEGEECLDTKSLKDDEMQQDTETENLKAFCNRHVSNLVHFLVEDWCLSAMLGIITAILSVLVDVIIEKLQHIHVVFYEELIKFNTHLAMFQWLFHITFLTFLSTLSCLMISKQAVGSGIPEVKVIMHGFKMKNYLTFRTLIAKMIGITLAMGAGLPIGKEGPFVHMGAIVATLLTKVTKACHYSAFFSNEGREIEMLSCGCAVGIACTFSAPVGGVLYAIESTSKYFAVKNYWKAFFAATCSAIVFRFANLFITSNHSGAITAFYQTKFPTESFVVEELLIFALIGLFGGLFASLFIFAHRRFILFCRANRVFKFIFRQNFFVFTLFMAFVVGILTYPEGFGKYIAGKLTFRETMADFFNNCTLHLAEGKWRACHSNMLEHWLGGSNKGVSVFLTLGCYFITYFILVVICISINVPAGVFVPSFIIGAAGGRFVGEWMSSLFPNGLRGPTGPHIYPGLYAVVGAAAYTGAVTHTLSVAVIICELTGQLAPLLPILISLLVGNAICKFLQPSIYESIIRSKKYPYLPDLPPSRMSVYTVKVEQIMVRQVLYITKNTTYKELREILRFAPRLKSFPVVTDSESKILLGSVARKYLMVILRRYFLDEQLRFSGLRRNTSAILNSIKRSSIKLSRRNKQAGETEIMKSTNFDDDFNGRSMSGHTLLAISPLHVSSSPFAVQVRHSLTRNHPFMRQISEKTNCRGKYNCNRIIDLEEIAIDSAPFQLVLGSSLYKVHTLFSLLGLSHAYITDCGRLVGVIALKEVICISSIFAIIKHKVLEALYSDGMDYANYSIRFDSLKNSSLNF